MKGGFFMQKSTTIIGILEMLEDGYSYRDIQARFAIGNSTITDIKKKFAAMDIPLKELAVKTPKAIESIFYANSHPRKNIPLPDFSKVYNSLTNKQTKTNLYFIWLDYKKCILKVISILSSNIILKNGWMKTILRIILGW